MRNISEAQTMESEAAQKIREAIAAQDYSTALHLWNGYMSQVRCGVSDGGGPAERLAEVRELFHWGRCALLCARSHYLDRLNAIRVAAAYTVAHRT
jgi:hypothetical protein